MSSTIVERSLEYIRDHRLHGVDLEAPAGYTRGIDVLGADLVPALRRSVSVFRRNHGYLPNLINPGSFTQKQLLFKFFAPIPLCSPADKLGSRDYLPAEYRDVVKIPEMKWCSEQVELPGNGSVPPGRYWLKSNHSSGRNKAVAFPLDRKTRHSLHGNVRKWLTKIHDRRRALWWYEVFDRKVFLEEDLSEEGFSANDWKFFVCGGKVAIYQYDDDRFGQHDQTVYDRSGKFLDQSLYYHGTNRVDPPSQLPLMVEVAEAIGKSFDFIRVDFFIHKNSVYLGELGLVPNGCSICIQSSFLDHLLGDRWFAPWLGADARRHWGYYETTRARDLFEQNPVSIPDASSIWNERTLDDDARIPVEEFRKAG